MRAIPTIAAAAVLAGLIGMNAYSISALKAIRSDLLDLRDQSVRSSEAINDTVEATNDALMAIRSDLAALRYHFTHSNKAINAASQTISGRIDDLQGRIDWLTANGKITIVPDLTHISLGGKHIKAVKAELRPDVDVVSVLSLRTSLNWTPKGPSDLPVDWPKLYIETYHQPFEPYTFAINAAIMAYQIKGKALKSDAPNIDALLAALKRYSDTLSGGALAVRYDFDNILAGGTIPAGWHSAFGNGAVVIGLLELAEATGDGEIRELADKYVDALRWQGTDSDIVMMDGSDFLWFEETPPLNGKPTHIMNGHIATVFSLYRYWQVTGDETVLPLVRAGLATAARYLPELRRPGQVPAYWLYDTSVPDYGPLRMINMTKTMGAISDNPVFGHIMEMLLTDSSVNR
jgi:hypothetical protein